ncbi:FAD-binding oxidoreductase [Palleronia sediminis]|uniref:FAD-binding oxidoreductase n=1 Tax=Palleronia sediminis TaxID=2547833 RepID=A0A4R6A134_9RHOB|nr:FAD-binding oxidoreductase [Palleronia sediminis]TDL76292.1 FAD-binding oxidoreductase [Palleronia sediminis]
MTLRPLTTALLDRLGPDLSDGTLRETAPAYLAEPRGMWQGRAGAVLAPRDTAEVARIVRFAAAERVGIVPWGGGTGLVGGQVMPDGAAPIVLSLERMRAIRRVWPDENVLVAEAGAILSDVQDAAREAGRLFPLSLASEGSARIGGLLSTNAGGVNVLRWGNARDLCLGIEAVMPDGAVLHGLRRLRKDNTGYDIRNLLIGAEGTLGVITAAALRLFPRPASRGVAMLVVPSPEAAIDLFHRADALGSLSAFELISGQGMRFLVEGGFDIRQPFAAIPEWAVLLEYGLTRGEDAPARLEALFEDASGAGLVSDGVLASSEAQAAALWAVREHIPLANRAVGSIASNDISLPIGEIPGFLRDCGARLAAMADIRINAFGHLGDGNLHYNLFPAPGRTKHDYADRAEALREIVNEDVAARDGSFSAEHGVGRLKVATLERYGDPARLQAMRAIKAALDPLGIMNPGAVLRAAGASD